MLRSRKLAASLMLLSGLTHVSQLAVYGTESHVIGAAVFGIIYFAIGCLLLGHSRLALWLGVVLPSIGTTAGIYRLAVIQVNPFTFFHLVINLFVIPICLYWLIQSRGKTRSVE